MAQDKYDRLLEFIVVTPVEAECCPCGRKPTLVMKETISWFECRKWLGLKLCRKGPVVMDGWRDGQRYAEPNAARAWNRSLASEGVVA
jgi:hypothetical protein